MLQGTHKLILFCSSKAGGVSPTDILCICFFLLYFSPSFNFLIFIYFPRALQSRVSSCEAYLVTRYFYTEVRPVYGVQWILSMQSTYTLRLLQEFHKLCKYCACRVRPFFRLQVLSPRPLSQVGSNLMWFQGEVCRLCLILPCIDSFETNAIYLYF